MQLQVGDRLTDETGDWDVVGRPYTTAGGKDARVRVQRVGKPGGTEIRVWRRARARQREADERRGGQAMMRLGRRAHAVARGAAWDAPKRTEA